MGLTLADVETIADIVFKLSATIIMAMLIWTAFDHRRKIEKLEEQNERQD